MQNPHTTDIRFKWLDQGCRRYRYRGLQGYWFQNYRFITSSFTRSNMKSVISFLLFFLPNYCVISHVMPSKFRVEPVQVSSDLTGVAKFCCGVFFNDVNEPEPFIKIAQIESESNQLFKEKLACMVRAFDGNNLIGYGQINWKGEVLRIESVCVAPTYRRKGTQAKGNN